MTTQKQTQKHMQIFQPKIKTQVLSRVMRGLCLTAFGIAVGLGCGPSTTYTNFTSTAVQFNDCKIVGNSPEVCTRNEVSGVMSLQLVENNDGVLLLHGYSSGDGVERQLVGSYDSEDGYLFVEKAQQVNSNTGCILDERLELSLHIDENAPASLIGTDACVALVGRETRTSITSEQCDTINTPPQKITRIVRRRWQADAECGQ